MNILDENILNDQKQLLKMWKIGVHQIGDDLGWKGMQKENFLDRCSPKREYPSRAARRRSID